ncbi:golgi apparatus membrane protein Tvp38p [[Candida] railenensis]|uniref:Golgi apparatus membrane protein TVP38 n=1 Tax=[Candida] railenensis TaxID=45579 RepID=A0A9P0QRV4_9ASCO|nr:golgi apparatus membrane protein Tvp38p [[Candida] railenensis]
MMPRLDSNTDPFRRPNTNHINSIYKQNLSKFQNFSEELTKRYDELTPTKKILVWILAVFNVIAVVLILIFHSYIIKSLVKLSDKWADLKFGHLLLFTLVFMVGFPPLLGFSPLSLLCGMVYGFPYGWPLLASAMFTGSFASFLVFRYLLHKQAVRLIQANEKFRAFSDILKEDQSLLILILIRLCPLPYSLSNGALAAIPELSAWTYALASLITSPKLLIHVYVGWKLKSLGDETKTFATKVVDFVSILITGAASALTTWLIYSRMQRKLEIYHSSRQQTNGDYDAMIFGNFDDNDLSSNNNVELDSNDFDADNFVIGDEDDDEEEVELDEVRAETDQADVTKSTSPTNSP